MNGKTPIRHAATLAAAAALLLPAAPAAASVITFKAWYSAANGPDPATAPQVFTQTDWTGVSQKIQVPQFDPSLGTLTAATLSLYADANATGFVQNTGAATATVKSYVANLRVRLLSPSSSASGPGITTAATASTPFLLEALPPLITVTNQSLAPGAKLPFSQSGANAASGPLDLFAQTGALPLFRGTGTATLPVYTGTRTAANATGGNLVVTQNTAARAEAVVTYTYTDAPAPPAPAPPEPDPIPVPVPVPASAVLLGAALQGLGLIRRR